VETVSDTVSTHHSPVPRLDLYEHAAREIPVGETRTFGELAAMAGSPAGARAAGRAMRGAGRGVPWHRVVAADGALDRARGEEQLRRLRREGARARSGEYAGAWARRRGLRFVASYRDRRLLAPDDPLVERRDATRLEGFASEASALARGFTPGGRAPARTVDLPSRPAGGAAADPEALALRLARLDWGALERGLLADGVAVAPRLLGPADCRALLAAGSDARRFDRTVHMETKGYGIGSYRYWKEPLPEPARTLRSELYPRLLPMAEGLEPEAAPFPPTLSGWHALCRTAGQERPSSILISYLAGGLNHPHQDAYGPRCFPVQALIVLSRRGTDFTGGDFALWTERGSGPLAARDVAADRGDLVLFAARRLGPGGPRTMHGMRLLERGRRDALGLVWHLAR